MPRLIDADALLESLCNDCSYYGRCKVPCIQYDMITFAPTIDAEPVRHGRWIPQDNTRTKFMCSDCKARNYDGSDNYCPKCGAKVDEEAQDAKERLDP